MLLSRFSVLWLSSFKTMAIAMLSLALSCSENIELASCFHHSWEVSGPCFFKYFFFPFLTSPSGVDMVFMAVHLMMCGRPLQFCFSFFIHISCCCWEWMQSIDPSSMLLFAEISWWNFLVNVLFQVIVLANCKALFSLHVIISKSLLVQTEYLIAENLEPCGLQISEAFVFLNICTYMQWDSLEVRLKSKHETHACATLYT